MLPLASRYHLSGFDYFFKCKPFSKVTLVGDFTIDFSKVPFINILLDLTESENEQKKMHIH